jgi:hypothetical protein
VLQFAFAAPAIAAELIGSGMGLGMAATIDPQNGIRPRWGNISPWCSRWCSSRWAATCNGSRWW